MKFDYKQQKVVTEYRAPDLTAVDSVKKVAFPSYYPTSNETLTAEYRLEQIRKNYYKNPKPSVQQY